MQPSRTFCALLALASAPSADPARPALGTVEKVTGDSLLLRFDAPGTAGLDAGRMVGIYGPGLVEKHPLTGEVIIERPALVAKAQLTLVLPGRVEARTLWRAEGLQPIAGFDAVPLGEPAPNTPPTLRSPIQPVTATIGRSVAVGLDILDPDGDPLNLTWSLHPAGSSGRLEATTSSLPTMLWQAPGCVGEAVLTVIARDRCGLEAAFSVPLSAQAPATGAAVAPEPPRLLARMGEGNEPSAGWLARDGEGAWWALDLEGGIHKAAPGWGAWGRLGLTDDQRPKKPAGLAAKGQDLYVLDAGRGELRIHALTGALRRSLRGLDRPSGVAVADDGTIYVADQGAGGVVIFEADGRLRGRLGGPGPEGFQGLTTVAVGAAGEVFALDALAGTVWIFARNGQRVGQWQVGSDAVAVAWTPGGLLLLRGGGGLSQLGPDGKIQRTWEGQGVVGLAEAGRPAALWSDPSGLALACFPESGSILRWRDGLCTGCRGAQLRLNRRLWAADGRGRLAALGDDDRRIRLLDSEGWQQRLLTAPGSRTTAMAFSPDGRALWLADDKNSCAYRLDLEQGGQPRQIGGAGEAPHLLQRPLAVAVDESGRGYVLDSKACKVVVYGADGTFLFTFGSRGSSPDQLDDPRHLAVSPDGGTVWIYDHDEYQVKRFALDHQAARGRFTLLGFGKGDGNCQLRECVGLACDRLGRLVLLDASRGDVQQVDFNGSAPRLIARKTLSEVGLGTPRALAVSPDGPTYIAAGGGTFSSAVSGLAGWMW